MLENGSPHRGAVKFRCLGRLLGLTKKCPFGLLVILLHTTYYQPQLLLCAEL
jgi:hypothetical protein